MLALLGLVIVLALALAVPLVREVRSNSARHRLRELAVIVTKGAEASRLAPVADRLPVLFGLGPAAGGNTDYQRASAVAAMLREAVGRLGTGPAGESAGLLLATAPEGRGRSVASRREAAAEVLFDGGMSASTFQRRHQAHLLGVVADELYRYDTEYRARQAYQGLSGAAQVTSELAIDWLKRFEHYYRMWTDISGLRNDLVAYLERRARDHSDSGLARYVESSLWFLARLLNDLQRFVEERGGLWLLGDADAEATVADAVYRITWHPPIGTLDDSRLRLFLLASSHGELADFLERVAADDSGRAIAARWQAWLENCACTIPDEVNPACEIHIVIGACDRYTDTIDTEWYRIADWYRQPPSTRLGAAAVDVGALFERFPYRLDPPDQG